MAIRQPGQQQDQATDQTVHDDRVDWLHAVLEADMRVCNNCFGRRTAPGESIEAAHEHSRSAGRNAMGGGKRTSQTAEIFCRRCGVGYGADDLVDLEVIPPSERDLSDADETPQDRTTGAARLVKIKPRFGSPGDLRVERAADGFEIVRETDAEAEGSAGDEQGTWEWPTNLTQIAARQAMGSIGREWSEQAPMPKNGATPSLLRCTVNACDRLEERGYTPDREQAKRLAAHGKDEHPSRDREVLAQALTRAVAQDFRAAEPDIEFAAD